MFFLFNGKSLKYPTFWPLSLIYPTYFCKKFKHTLLLPPVTFGVANNATVAHG